jgi:predicted metalloprotease
MGRLPIGGGRGAPLGLGGVVLLVVLALVFGRDFLSMSSDPNASAVPYDTSAPVTSTPEEEKLVELVSFVLDDAQNMWTSLLPGYERAKLVLFRDATPSACGLGQSATGPFYCPSDQKVYIDLGFYQELRRRFGAPGDFAQAYVLAHEIGHHVQNLQGTERQVRQLQQSRPSAANDLSVRMELQADCYAGVWGYSASERNHLEPGDVEEGLAAAAAIGDDRIQRMSGTRVAPERWTHGSSEQRVEWFRRGMRSGRPQDCDTFSAR